jgi:hypothetical protein
MRFGGSQELPPARCTVWIRVPLSHDELKTLHLKFGQGPGAPWESSANVSWFQGAPRLWMTTMRVADSGQPGRLCCSVIAGVRSTIYARAHARKARFKVVHSGLLFWHCRQPMEARGLIWGAALSGDPKYIPWIIGHMADDQLARAAGEAFSFITGADIAWLDLDRKPPEQHKALPNEDPEDLNIAMGPDEGLPWPDQARVQDWWIRQRESWISGRRYFGGQLLARASCIEILKSGFQRQRMTAAMYLSLLDPGRPLFECRAPARRQRIDG